MALTIQEKLKNLDKLADGVNKKAGKIMLGRISKSEDLRESLKTEFIKFPSLNLNEATGGGIPKGKVTIVSGNPDSGKTFLLLEMIGLEMAKDPNFVAGWLESEGSLTADNLEQFNIDLERFFYQRFDKASGAEKSLDSVEAALLTGLDMFVVNSLKCLVPAEEFEKSMEKQQIGLQARMNSKMMRKLKPIVTENKVAFVLVQHLTTEIGSMSRDPLILSGGRQIRHGADLIIDMRKRSIGDTDQITREEGIKIGVSVTKNHVVTNRFPYLKTEYYGIFGQGTEIYLEAIELAVNQGILTKAGAYIRVPDENGDPMIVDGEKMQWQGTAKFREYCKDNPDFFNNMRDQIEGEVDELSDEEVNKAKAINEEVEDKPVKKAGKKAPGKKPAKVVEEDVPVLDEMEDVLEESKE